MGGSNSIFHSPLRESSIIDSSFFRSLCLSIFMDIGLRILSTPFLAVLGYYSPWFFPVLEVLEVCSLVLEFLHTCPTHFHLDWVTFQTISCQCPSFRDYIQYLNYHHDNRDLKKICYVSADKVLLFSTYKKNKKFLKSETSVNKLKQCTIKWHNA